MTEYTLLIVDDDPHDLDLLSTYLNQAGFKVLTAPDGASALSYIAQIRPHMLLLDIKMPGLDGMELCRRLKADDITRKIPIIFLSGVSEPGEKAAALDLGAVDYITKPFQAAEVIARVEKHLALDELQKRLEAQNARLEQEVAERKQTEETLRQSELKYRGVIENSVDGIVLVDEEGLIIEWNQAQEKLTGLVRGEVVGQPIWDVQFKLALPAQQTPEAYEQLKAFTQKLFDTGYLEPHLSRPLERAIQRVDGEQRIVQSVTYSIPTERGFMFNTIMRDVTDFKHTEQALRENEEWLRLAYNVANLGTWRHDLTTGITHFDASACRHYGLDSDDLSLAEVTTHIHPDDVARVQQEIAASLDPGGDGYYALEYRVIHKDGSIHWLAVHAQVYFEDEDSTRRPVLRVGTSQDITARKQIEAELKAERASLAQRVAERTAELSRANAELAQAARAKDEFLANMSHELRTPLNAVLGLSESLQEQLAGPLNERQLKSVVTIERSGRHLLELINDILDLAKVEAGKMEFQPQPVGVLDICQASLVFVREMANEKDVQLSFHLSDWQMKVEADPRRLKQILVNLLSNAVKFTPPGGQVRLEVILDAEEEAIRFAVQDNGMGITAEDMAKLFKPFTQLDGSLSRKHPGTGLGLALVRRLVDLHRGSVIVESEGILGRGSCFTVVLPWSAAAEETPAEVAAPVKTETRLPEQAVVPSKARVLLAEDNETSIEVINDYLTYQGYQVIVARDGQESLQQAAENKPDLILMDIHMPGLDGLQVTRRLRAIPEFASTPIIALTALAMPGDRERCLEAGATQYLTKPVSLKGLLETMEGLLKR